MGKGSLEEFKAYSLQEWKKDFHRVREFLEWCRENHYIELSNVKNFSPIKEYYERSFLRGEVLIDGKWKSTKDSHTEPVGRIEHNKPKDYENDVIKSAALLLWHQFGKGWKLHQKGVMRGMMLVTCSAYCSVLGLTSHQFNLSCDYEIMEFVFKTERVLDSIKNEVYSVETLYPIVEIVEHLLDSDEMPSLEQSRLTATEFRISALEHWKKSFPLVVGFIDWISKHNFTQLGSISPTKYPIIQDIYHECVLLGKNQSGLVDTNHIPVLSTIVWICENVTPTYETLFFRASYKWVSAQEKWIDLNRDSLIKSLMIISMAAMTSSLGITESDIKKHNYVHAKEVRRVTETFLKLYDEGIQDFEVIIPLIRLVAQILNVSTSVIFDNIPSTGLVERPLRRGITETITESESNETEEVLTLECSECGHSDSYKEGLIRTFGFVRCKGCGTKLEP